MKLARIIMPMVFFMGSSLAFSDTTLNLSALKNGELIENYFNGGYGSLGSGPGPNYGISFSSLMAIISTNSGGSGSFSNNPSGGPVMYFVNYTEGYMDVPAGFGSSLSFYYAASKSGGLVTVWSGLDGTGTELAFLDLPLQFENEDNWYGTWSPETTSFSGIAESVSFGPAADSGYIGFDEISVGPWAQGGGGGSEVPEPGSFVLFGAGLIGLVSAVRRRPA